MLARLTPQNAASTFGASIEQALQSVDVRVKRLEDQAGQVALEEAIRSAEARLQRLERERDGQARTLEKVEALVASRAQELRQNVNRSLEVIVDKVRGETESLRNELSSRDSQLRKDFSLELDNVRELRKLVDSFSDIEDRFQTDFKATKDVCMASILQLGGVEDSLGHLRASVAALPPFLWGLNLGEGPFRSPPLDARRPSQGFAGGLAGGLAPSALLHGAGGVAAEAGGGKSASRAREGRRSGGSVPAAGKRRQSPGSDSTEPPSPRRREGENDPSGRSPGWLARAALAEGPARSTSAEARRRKGIEKRSNREALDMASLAGEALLDAADRKRGDEERGGLHAAMALGGRQHSALAIARLAGEAFMGKAAESS